MYRPITLPISRDLHMLVRTALISLSPTDNRAIEEADPTDATQAELDALVANDRTGALEGYLDILRVAQKAFDDAVDVHNLNSYGPGELLEGIEGVLAELCIPGADPHRLRP